MTVNVLLSWWSVGDR